MSHVRQQIRAAVITELKKITAFGSRVYGYRGMVQKTAPYVIVRSGEEEIITEMNTFGSDGHPTLMREIQLSIEVRDKVKTSTNIDDTMDGYAVSIEEKMAGTALNSLAKYVLPGSMRIETNDDNEKLEQDTALMTLVFPVRYRTKEGSPETAIL